jgi:hypothetical protein
MTILYVQHSSFRFAHRPACGEVMRALLTTSDQFSVCIDTPAPALLVCKLAIVAFPAATFSFLLDKNVLFGGFSSIWQAGWNFAIRLFGARILCACMHVCVITTTCSPLMKRACTDLMEDTKGSRTHRWLCLLKNSSYQGFEQ